MAFQNFISLYSFVLVLSSLQLQAKAVNDFAHFFCKYGKYREQCNKNLTATWKYLPKNESFCKGKFDGYICWPHTKINSLAKVNCPIFISSSEPEIGHAYQFCYGDGSWFHTNSNKSWSFKEECKLLQQTQALEKANPRNHVAVLNTVTVICTIGYGVSLASLIVALNIFFFFKKLHCIRNYVHMNLMLSFILCYVAILVKDKVLQDFYDLEKWSKKENILNLNCKDFLTGDILIGCRIAIVFMHYALTCNYFWLFVEGVHLQLLLIYPMNNNKLGRYFSFYMAFGWGVSMCPILIWVVLMLTYANLGCWETSDEMKLWWVIRFPVVATIVINFIIFINVIRIIFSKLRARNMDRNDYKYTMAKSTLILIPLLGIHYIFFIVIDEGVVDSRSSLLFVKIGFDLIFTSIQGTLVALFYCFLNSEVRGEIRKFWRKWRAKNNMEMSAPTKLLTVHHSHGTQMTSLISSSPAEARV